MTTHARRRTGAGICAVLAACLCACSGSATPTKSATAAPRSAAVSSRTPTPSSTTPTATPTRPSTPAAASPTTTHAASHRSRAATVHRSASADRLPLPDPTGSARQVVTVTARSSGATIGTLQAWRRVSGGWRKVGPAVTAHLGSDGMSRHPSEARSATPIGGFTLTQAFGRFADPGTALPYTHTTPADWWVSQPGAQYNTRQRCSSQCAFTRGDPNEHLYYETPFYEYAVVIDYNTRNAPGGVRQGAGSAFFLHVTVGQPTQGCVSIARDQLTRIMRWLQPGDHPRILIGVA